jgi:hypothetical protein
MKRKGSIAMNGGIALSLAILMTPGIAAAQEPRAKAPSVHELPAVKPPVAPLVPDTTKSKDETSPTEDVSPSYEPIEWEYKEQREDGESGHVPASYPIGDAEAGPDVLRVVSIEPAAGDLIASDAMDVRTRDREIECRTAPSDRCLWVTLAYEVNSRAEAHVDAVILSSSPEADREITSYRHVDTVRDSGRTTLRIAVTCDPDSPIRVRGLRLRYSMYDPGGRPLRLVVGEQPLPHTIVCRTITGPGAAARLPDRDDPPPSFEAAPAAARPGQRLPPRPVSPPAGRPVDVAQPPAERIGACPDPATVDLSARLVGRTDPSRGVGIIEIVGRVRNIGRDAYVSEPRQQSIELIEEQAGTPPRIVAEQTFTNLAPNATRTVVHRRSWDTSTEFQPRYRLRIVYEPDIRTDANPRNDDCGLANNEATLEPDRINALFP